MKFSLFAVSAVQFLSGVNAEYCTAQQAADVEAAIQQAVVSILPSNYDSAEAYLEAMLTEIQTILGGGDISSTYPCYACFETFMQSMFTCGTGECTEEQITSLYSNFMDCAVGSTDGKDSVCLSTLSAAALGLSVVLL